MNLLKSAFNLNEINNNGIELKRTGISPEMNRNWPELNKTCTELNELIGTENNWTITEMIETWNALNWPRTEAELNWKKV